MTHYLLYKDRSLTKRSGIGILIYVLVLFYNPAILKATIIKDSSLYILSFDGLLQEVYPAYVQMRREENKSKY